MQEGVSLGQDASARKFHACVWTRGQGRAVRGQNRQKVEHVQKKPGQAEPHVGHLRMQAVDGAQGWRWSCGELGAGELGRVDAERAREA